MKPSLILRIPFLTLILFSLACTKQELRAEDKTPDLKERGSTIIWYDGNDEKKAYVLSNYIAEFSKGTSRLKSLDKSARLVIDSDRIKIHKLSETKLISSLQKGVVPKEAQLSGDYSPVFSENGSDSSLMVLPGNVIVRMDNSYSEKQVEEWAKRQNVKILKKLDISIGNFYLIETGSGFSCLDKAKELRASEGVLSTAPEWWGQAQLR